MGSPSARLVRRSRARLRRVRSALTAQHLAATVPQARRVLDALARTLKESPAVTRVRALLGPDIRGFLSEVETWLAVRRQAAAILASRRSQRSEKNRIREAHLRRMQIRLFDRISRTQFLVELTPRGRTDAGFASRCLRLSSRRLNDAVFDLAALTLGLRLIHPRPGAFRLLLQFREDGELGRPADRIDLGTIAGPAGPLAIAPWSRGIPRPRPGRRPPPARNVVRAKLTGTTLRLSAPGSGASAIPAAGTRLSLPDHELERNFGGGRPAGVPFRQGDERSAGAAFFLERREMIPGTSIVLSPVVESQPHRLIVGRADPSLARRLARALRIVLVAWPEAYREIERRTFMVVPIHEPGTVSYSMAARPGISFIRMTGKSLIDLADDLLHESAHHRLHDLQETADFLRRGAETLEIQAFHSPWRGELRPLHGLLHGAYTFLFRAELFRRILVARPSLSRLLTTGLKARGLAFVRRELGRERRMLASALGDLESAAGTGLLTREGRDLVRRMRQAAEEISGPVRRRESSRARSRRASGWRRRAR